MLQISLKQLLLLMAAIALGIVSLKYASPAWRSAIGFATTLCIFFAAFWTLRLIAATFIFDMRPYLTNTWRRLGYQVINIVFIYLPVVYAWAAWRGGR